MMFNKFVVFAVLAVTLLAMSAHGHPADEAQVVGETTEETTTVKQGIRGWIKNLGKKIHEHKSNCNHTEGKGGVINWMKNKLGFKKTTTTTTNNDQPMIGDVSTTNTWQTTIDSVSSTEQPDTIYEEDGSSNNSNYQPDDNDMTPTESDGYSNSDLMETVAEGGTTDSIERLVIDPRTIK